MNKPLVFLGGGGHALVLLDILRQQNREILAVSHARPNFAAHLPSSAQQLGKDVDVLEFGKNEVELVNGLGYLPRNPRRKELFLEFKEKGYQFASVIADSATVSQLANLGEGVQILQGSIVQAGSIIGDNSIINSRSVVEHECAIGSHNHIAPGAVLCGNVQTQEQVFVGSNSTVTQTLTIGADTVIGAGAIVSRNLPSGHIVYPPRCETLPLNKE